jgi:glycosyltransferase 2 family protein
VNATCPHSVVISRRSVWRVVQAAFVVAVLWHAVRLLAGQWTAVRSLRASLDTEWSLVIGSSLVVLLSYAVLIATWRATVRAWGERLGVADAARIWFVSNLGRYIPGKVWQIGAMGALAQLVGVSPIAAVGSALVVSLVHVVVGFAVVTLTGRELLTAALPPGPSFAIALAALAVALIAAPWLLAPLVAALRRLTGRDLVSPHLPPRAVWVAAVGSFVAWILFGVAFRLLATGLLGGTAGGMSAYVAVFTLSYLLGFLALFAPGGIGVRELSMAALLVSAGLTTEPEAAWLVVGSRLWLTVLEILPGTAFLLFRPRNPMNEPPQATDALRT